MQEKTGNIEIFLGNIWFVREKALPLHRFFSKHYDFSCDGELSKKVLTT
jgi:hypothetical protein